MMKKQMLALPVLALSLGAVAEIVSFKDAAKIKSWDAWNDHKSGPAVTNVLQKEKRCVTWEKLNRLDYGLKEIGRLQTRTSDQIKSSSKWSVGCETMDRDYAEWDNFKQLLPLTGVKHARFFSGWAKTEQEKGKYDFSWLDPQIRECAAMGVKPWVCISYGNPVWGSDFRLGMRVKQVTDVPEAFEAWLRYTKELVGRYKDVVDEWEVWNEPFNQAKEYAEMFYRTAKVIREVQPTAKIYCTAISMNKDMEKSDYKVVLEKLKAENALDLGSYFIYHPYSPLPEATYSEDGKGQFGWTKALALRKLVKGYSPKFDIMQGEVGCPAQLEFAHAMNSIEWTEYSQAKWDLRRAIGDAARNIPSSSFTFIDLQYTFMLQSYGFVRSNTLKEFVYRRPKFYAMRNVYTLFDDDTHAVGVEGGIPAVIERRADPRDDVKRTLTCARFERLGQRLWLYWYDDQQPSNRLEFDRVTLTVPGEIRYPHWVDMITGRVCAFDEKNIVRGKGRTVITDVPMWDSPVLICSVESLTLACDWAKMTPFEIVDHFYRPGQYRNLMKAYPAAHTNEPWMTMKTSDFLPCIDRFGQFKWRDWPGKTHGEADLKAAAEDEARDLAANPGAEDRDRFGGWAKGPQLEATGRFRTHKDEKGKWWLVDPEGRLFWSFGAVRVTASSAMTPMNGDKATPPTGVPLADRDCWFEDLSLERFWKTHDDLLWPFYLARGETRVYDFSSANLFRKYGEDYYEMFSDLCHRRLRSWGLNTIANSSDLKICLQDRTPYAERVEVKGGVVIAGSWGAWGKFRDPFAPSFKSDVIRSLEEHGKEAHDPWCIGFFVDNEIQWGRKAVDLATWTLWSPDDQPAKVEFLNRLSAKGIVWDGDLAKIPEAELVDFSRAVCEEYFKRTREAVKEFDPGLLYLGCRFATAPDWAVTPCVKYCDVVSWNIYRDTIDDWRVPGGADAPVLIGEFHFGATDRGPFGTGVKQAKDQDDRAAKMKAYVASALANPQIVGIHWHQFSDQATTGRFDGEYLQVGFTDICDTPYPEMRKALREVGYGLYEARGR